jgi:solute carrier family 41
MGNIALIQCQASTVGFIAPLIALGLSLIHDQSRILNWKQVVLLVASSVITANVANLILGSLMCGVIVLSRRFKINPDNIATPIAASLGDVTTMILLANISHFLYVNLETNQWVQNTLLAFLMSLIPVWAYIARKNPFTRKVILNGWYPVCGAMLIQNAGGLVMERALKSFNKIANLQLLINGVGGNLVAIQSSRMSTHLHKYSVMGDKNKDDDTIDCREKMKCNPLSTFSSSNPHSNFALLLLSISVPSHILFLFLTEVVNKKYFFTPSFIIIYLFVGVTQVMILLQFSYKFVHWLWSVKVNPDNSAIPFLTAIADLIGSLFLATAFNVLYAMRDPNAYTAVLSTVTSTVSRSLPMTPSPFPLNNQHVLASPTSPMFSTTTPLPVITSVNTTHF